VIRAVSEDDDTISATGMLDVCRVEINPAVTNVCVHMTNDTVLSLMNSYWGTAGVMWGSTPSGLSSSTTTGETFVLTASNSTPGEYEVKAWIVGYTNCMNVGTVRVVEADLDVDSNNDGGIEANNLGEDGYEQYSPGVIVCVDRHGDDTNLDHLVEMKLAFSPTNLTSGTLTLEASSNGANIRIWTTTNKTSEVILPTNYSLATCTAPSSLWIDGVSTGQVVLDLYYKDSGGTEICRDQVAVFVTKTVSRSPSGHFAFGWEPCGWLGNGGQGTATAETVLDNVVSQGWDNVMARYQDVTGGDDSVSNCTLANFKGMRLGGLVEVSTHGWTGYVCAVYVTSYSAATNWISGESNMVAVISSAVTNPPMYYVRVYTKWFEDNWKLNLDANDAIIMFMTCHGAGGGTSSLVNRAGGRVRFGYEDSPEHIYMRSNNNKLFGRMNGSQDSGNNRCTGEAYDTGTGYDNDLDMFGSDWTTLCPAPVAVFPASSPGNRKGWGCIIFDTYMDDSYAATQAVTKISGSCSVSNFRWVDNGSGKFCLGFDFDNTGGGGATMRAHAFYCVNSCTLGRQLDGNRVQENGDDRDWAF
jgi:hypothetical protein